VVDFLGSGARHDQLIHLGRRRRQHRFHIQVRPADLTIRLDRQHMAQELLVLGIHFIEIL
jgi:hypothetical protein